MSNPSVIAAELPPDAKDAGCQECLDCAKALEESDGDLTRAVDLLEQAIPFIPFDDQVMKDIQEFLYGQ